MRRLRRFVAFAVVAWSGGAAGGLGACGLARAPAAAGEACDLAADCVLGLVCIEQRGGQRVCSSNLSRVEGDAPEGNEPAQDDAGADGGEPDPEPDASTPPPRPDAATPDTGAPDAATPPPADAGADAD